MFYDCDVIVVGAGPAGSLAAYTLASQGIKITLLEKSPFPRYKVCGGGLTHKILKEIPFDLSQVIETTIHSFRFSHKLGSVFTRHSDEPIMYCTMRGELDAYLLNKAIQAGADVKTGEHVLSFEQDGRGVTVKTKERSYRCRLLIGAEGASGIVSRVAGLRGGIEMGMAWEAEVDCHPGDLERFSGTVFLDWGTIPGGYAWVFPKKDHFSIGVGGPATLSNEMMPYYHRFVSSLGSHTSPPSILNSPSSILHPPSSGIRFGETNSLKSWPIPVRTRNSNFHNGHVLIAGDGAGLGDPLTGEGIYYAVRSGKLAAETCYEYLTGKILSMDNYSGKINDELMPELLEANRIKNIFNRVPRRIHYFVGESDRAWRAFCKILQGERWYRDVRNGFGRWKFFWNLACFMAGIVEKRKERNYKFR